jgi:hypothetical protein
MPILQDAHGFTFHNPNLTDIAGSQYNYTTNIYSAEERALAALRPAIREGYEVSRCMEGTRETIFKQIDVWLDDMSTFRNLYVSTQDI